MYDRERGPSPAAFKVFRPQTAERFARGAGPSEPDEEGGLRAAPQTNPRLDLNRREPQAQNSLAKVLAAVSKTNLTRAAAALTVCPPQTPD